MRCHGSVPRTLGRVTLLGVAVVFGPSCDLISPICTAVGCYDGLRVTLDPAAVLPYRAMVSFPEGQVVTFQCSSDGVQDRTGDGIFSLVCSGTSFSFLCNGNPPSSCSTSPVLVQLMLADGTRRSGRLTPRYSFLQPNGPRCGPTCAGGVAALP